MVTEITKEQIIGDILDTEEHLHVVMFYGATCGPCKATMPHYENVATQFVEKTDTIKFYKIHAWENEEARQYCKEVWGVEGVPGFKLLFRRQVIGERKGGGDEAILHTMIHEAVDNVFKQFEVKV